MSLITKKETVTEERDVSYNKCDKCGVEAIANAQYGSNWMTCVKLGEKDRQQLEMLSQIVGEKSAMFQIANKCSRSLCDKCSLLFEKFVEQSV